MEENELKELGFRQIDDDGFTDWQLGCIYITGCTLVEVFQNDEFITVKNCNTIEDLKQLIKLFV